MSYETSAGTCLLHTSLRSVVHEVPMSVCSASFKGGTRFGEVDRAVSLSRRSRQSPMRR